MNKLKTILESDLETLAILMVLLSLSLFNYYYFIAFSGYLYFKRKSPNIKYYLLVLLLVLLTNLTFKQFSYNKKGYYLVREAKENSSIVGDKVIFEKLNPLSIYYIDGTLEDFEETRVLGEFDAKRYYLASGVNKVFVPREIREVRKSLINTYLDRYIKFLKLDEKTSSYLETILLARNKLNKDTKDVYASIGISHIFSVSGLHITLFSFLLIKILGLFLTKEESLDYLSFFLLIYILISSFSVSVVRASLLFIFKNIFKKLKLDVSNLNILALIMIILLSLNIFSANDASFKLSFITSYAILKLNSEVKNSLSISLICFLVTLPIIINLNHSFSLLSPLYNIFYISFFTSLVMPLAIAALLGIDILGLFSLSINFLENLSLFLKEADVVISTCHLHPVIVILYYLLFIYLIKNLRTSFKFIISYFIFVGFFSYLGNLSLAKIVMIDVDQGLSIYVRDGKHNYLYDTGGLPFTNITKKRVVPLLKYYGVEDLDLFISHGDNDHASGIKDINENFKVNKTFIAKLSTPKLYSLVYKYPLQTLVYGDKIHNFKVLGPTVYDPNKENNNSLVLKYQFGNYTVLFTGDSETFEFYEKCDILFLGHHGSKTSTNSYVLEKTRPLVCLSSAGSKYHHPSQEVINLVDFYRIPHLITKEDKSIYIYELFNQLFILNHDEMRLIWGVI